MTAPKEGTYCRFCSSAAHLDELAPYLRDYLINTRNLHISYLDEPDARELITHPVKNFPRSTNPPR